MQKRIKRSLNKLWFYIRETYIDKPVYTPQAISLKVVPSSNYFKDPNRPIKLIVLHATGSSSLRSTVEWFKDKKSKVSAHYVIDRDGKVVQMVGLDDIAWHAGDSEWEGQHGCNRFSLGIELVNLNDGKQDYPREQVNACLAITLALSGYYGLGISNVVGHKDISPGRKSDPNGFSMDEFKKSLSFHKEKQEACR